jgi:hypothetical protein
MDVHPEVENDNSNANPPSDTEDNFGDKQTAAETYQQQGQDVFLLAEKMCKHLLGRYM